jgi:hypothetical protein
VHNVELSQHNYMSTPLCTFYYLAITFSFVSLSILRGTWSGGGSVYILRNIHLLTPFFFAYAPRVRVRLRLCRLYLT